MSRAIAAIQTVRMPSSLPHEVLRVAIVCASAVSLIAAGQAFPL